MRIFICLVLIFSSFAELKAVSVQEETFDRSLGRLNTIARLQDYIDSCAAAGQVRPGSKEEVLLINGILERKFYHGYSHYSAQDNFWAYLAGKYVWDHLSAIVLPEDLVKHPMAACSQQALVMMQLLQERGYQVRKLILQRHYLLEVFYDQGWHMFDPNKEPSSQGLPHDSLDAYLINGKLSQAYSRTLSPEQVKTMFGRRAIGKVNAVEARNARVFHCITKSLSQPMGGVLVGSILGFFFILKKRKKKKSNLNN